MWCSQKREGLGMEGPALGLHLLPTPAQQPSSAWGTITHGSCLHNRTWGCGLTSGMSHKAIQLVSPRTRLKSGAEAVCSGVGL